MKCITRDLIRQEVSIMWVVHSGAVKINGEHNLQYKRAEWWLEYRTAELGLEKSSCVDPVPLASNRALCSAWISDQRRCPSSSIKEARGKPRKDAQVRTDDQRWTHSKDIGSSLIFLCFCPCGWLLLRATVVVPTERCSLVRNNLMFMLTEMSSRVSLSFLSLDKCGAAWPGCPSRESRGHVEVVEYARSAP